MMDKHKKVILGSWPLNVTVRNINIFGKMRQQVIAAVGPGHSPSGDNAYVVVGQYFFLKPSWFESRSYGVRDCKSLLLWRVTCLHCWRVRMRDDVIEQIVELAVHDREEKFGRMLGITSSTSLRKQSSVNRSRPMPWQLYKIFGSFVTARVGTTLIHWSDLDQVHSMDGTDDPLVTLNHLEEGSLWFAQKPGVSSH